MDIPVTTVDEYGIHVPSYDEYHAWLVWNFRELYGQDIYLEADSQDGQLIGIMALALYDAGQTSAMVYHSFAPNYAVGTGLSRLVKINGIKRRMANYSTVDVRIVGQVGTTIRNGLVEDILGNRWEIPVLIVIPTEGEVTVTATAIKPGAIHLQIGELVKIATPTRGWQTVENTAVSVPGIATESDTELRIRQTYSTALPSKTVNEGIIGGIMNLPGVVKGRHYENFENFWALPAEPKSPTGEGIGIPPHSICDVVLGGEPQAIGDTIRMRKTPGTGVYGDVYVSTVDSMGYILDMQFFRPVILPISIRVTIEALPRYSGDTATLIKNNVKAYIDSLRIGESLWVNRLYKPIEEADGSSYQPTFNILSLETSQGGSDWSAASLVRIDYKSLIQTDTDSITVSLSE